MRAPRQGERFDGFQPLQTLENVITWSRVQRGEIEQWTESTREIKECISHVLIIATKYLVPPQKNGTSQGGVRVSRRTRLCYLCPAPTKLDAQMSVCFLRHPLYAADPPTRPLSCIIIARGRQAKKPFPSSYAQYTACGAQIEIESSEENAESAVVSTAQSILLQGRWFMRELQIAYPYRRFELQDME